MGIVGSYVMRTLPLGGGNLKAPDRDDIGSEPLGYADELAHHFGVQRK
jgi:hypothetical protein